MKKNFLAILLVFLLIITASCDMGAGNTNRQNTFRLLMSEDLQPFEAVVKSYLSKEGSKAKIEVTYEGISTIRNILQSSECSYDAVWLSSSIPLNMVDGGQKIASKSYTCTSPVVFAIKEQKAKELGLMGDITVSDITQAIGKGISFVIPNVTQTNSGLTAYLGLISGISGNPTVLTTQHLKNPKLQEELVLLFSTVERSSGSDQFVTKLFKEGGLEEGYNCTVSSEATIIQLNQELEAEGKEILRLLYPSGAVTINDYPLGYIDKGDKTKLEEFLDFQAFVMGDEGRDILSNLGLRTELGGLVDPEYESVFKEEWGVKTKEYISSIVYPPKSFITEALKVYQELFKKPAHTVFCLDFSGSMDGNGIKKLMEAMEYILDPAKASLDFIQFSEADKVSVVTFSSSPSVVGTVSGDKTLDLLEIIRGDRAGGGTAMHAGLVQAIAQFHEEDVGKYTMSIVNMTDGEANSDSNSQSSLEGFYAEGKYTIPVYSIMFGNADPRQLNPIASYSNGKVFDGRIDLKKAFQEVRGYN